MLNIRLNQLGLGDQTAYRCLPRFGVQSSRIDSKQSRSRRRFARGPESGQFTVPWYDAIECKSISTGSAKYNRRLGLTEQASSSHRHIRCYTYMVRLCGTATADPIEQPHCRLSTFGRLSFLDRARHAEIHLFHLSQHIRSVNLDAGSNVLEAFCPTAGLWSHGQRRSGP